MLRGSKIQKIRGNNPAYSDIRKPAGIPVLFPNHEERPLDSSERKELVQVQLLTSHAKLPFCATIGSAGYDLISPEAISIPAYSRKSIDIGAGVIDSDFRGSVKALLINNGNVPFQVAKGDRIAQMIIEKIST